MPVLKQGMQKAKKPGTSDCQEEKNEQTSGDLKGRERQKLELGFLR